MKSWTGPLAVLTSATIALAWLTPTVQAVLATTWPVLAAAVAALALSAALAGSVYLIGLAVRSLRPPAPVDDQAAPPKHIHEMHAPFVHTRSVIDLLFADDEATHADRWSSAVQQFVLLGDQVGFGVRDLQPHLSRRERAIYVALLTAKPHQVLISDHRSTRWAPGWRRGALRAALREKVIALPYPRHDPPAVPWHRPPPAHAAHTAHALGTASA